MLYFNILYYNYHIILDPGPCAFLGRLSILGSLRARPSPSRVSSLPRIM